MFQAGTWYRSRMRLEGDTVVPYGTVTPYDPFSWYFPEEKSTHDPSIHYQFLDVNSEDPSAILRFCERFGVLGPLIYPLQEEVRNRIKSIGGELLNGDGKEGILKLSRLFFQAMQPPTKELLQPMLIGEFKTRQSLLRSAVRMGSFTEVPETKGRVIARDIIKSVSFLFLASASPRLDWNEQAEKWVISWGMTSLDAYFAWMFALDLTGSGKVIVCLKCGKPRYASNPRMRFCSPRCQNAFKVHAFYVRRKAAQVKERNRSRSK